MEAASIRYKNPGAMWGTPLAIKWGAAPKAVVLNDGKGQNNNIAVFPTFVQGICAQLDLWRSSKNYRNKRFADAIAIWSGHNEVPSYIAYCKKRVPGLTENTIMDDAFWKGPMGIAFLKAQAGHEAGKTYPAPDADWIEAQRRVFGGLVPAVVPVAGAEPKKPPVTTADVAKAVIVGGGGGAVATGVHQGWGAFEWSMLAGGVILAGVLAYLVWRYVWPWVKAQRFDVLFLGDAAIAPVAVPPVAKIASPSALPAPAAIWNPSTALAVPTKPRAPRKAAAAPKGKKKPARKTAKRKAA